MKELRENLLEKLEEIKNFELNFSRKNLDYYKTVLDYSTEGQDSSWKTIYIFSTICGSCFS